MTLQIFYTLFNRKILLKLCFFGRKFSVEDMGIIIGTRRGAYAG